MNRSLTYWTRYATLFYLAACAGGPTSSAGPTPERRESPRMLSRGSAPALRIPSTASRRSPVRVTIEVLIDSTGRPDMKTFKAMGFGAAENRDALARWIEQAFFRPAHRASQPVPGLFRMKLEARIVAR